MKFPICSCCGHEMRPLTMEEVRELVPNFNESACGWSRDDDHPEREICTVEIDAKTSAFVMRPTRVN